MIKAIDLLISIDQWPNPSKRKMNALKIKKNSNYYRKWNLNRNNDEGSRFRKFSFDSNSNENLDHFLTISN
jgi:accessory colonization factor AcfC